MTPTREILEAALHGYTIQLEAALQGFTIQKEQIEAKINEIREALNPPVTKGDHTYKPSDIGTPVVIPVTSFGSKWPPKKRKMSAAGRAAISAATKKRWAKYRKEQKRA